MATLGSSRRKYAGHRKTKPLDSMKNSLSSNGAASSSKFFPEPWLFSEKWGISDVALRCTENFGLLLHANKKFMATFSPFFNALFFSEFAEKKQEVVDLDVGYWEMSEILRILHHSITKFGNQGHKLYPTSSLNNMFCAADKYDIPLIRELVNQQITEHSPSDAYRLSVELDLEVKREESLERMTKEDIQKFLEGDNEGILISPRDMQKMMRKWGMLDVPEVKAKEKPVAPIANSDKIPENFKNKWGTSDVVLRVKEHPELSLHANKSVLAVFSPFFKSLFFDDPCDNLQDVVDLDVEHGILVEILKILLHVETKNFWQKEHNLYDASALCKMYKAAEKYEIEVVQKLCREQLCDLPPKESFYVAVELGFKEEKAKIFSNMTVQDFEAYLKTNPQNISFTANEVSEMLWKLKVHVKEKHCPQCSLSNFSVQPRTSQFTYFCNSCSHPFN